MTNPTAGAAVDLMAHLHFDLDLVPLSKDDNLVRQISGAWVMVVRTDRGVTYRRCWLSIATAIRHARRAIELGHRAEVYRVELRPAWQLTGWESAP